MDIQKAQRLIESGILSAEEDNHFRLKAITEGNPFVMNEILTIITLRRGGFDSLLSALRQCDYMWVAEQLDPEKSYTNPGAYNISQDGLNSLNSSVHNIMSAVCQRFSRKTGSIVSTKSNDDLSIVSFMSYRDECQMDLPINPSSYNQNGMSKNTPLKARKNSSRPSSTISQFTEVNNALIETLNLNEKDDDTINSLPSYQAVVYNVSPEQLVNADAKEYFTNLAKQANVPSPMIKDLKIIRSKKISKITTKKTKLKLQFNSETARNTFVKNLNKFLEEVESTDARYGTLRSMKVSIPKSRGRIISKVFRRGSQNIKSTERKYQPETSRKNWYQKPFGINHEK